MRPGLWATPDEHGWAAVQTEAARLAPDLRAEVLDLAARSVPPDTQLDAAGLVQLGEAIAGLARRARANSAA